MNKRYANELHSHEGRRLHNVDDVFLDKMISCGPHLSDENILDIFSEYDGRSKVEDTEKAISMLEELRANGHDNICVKSILRSKRKILKKFYIPPTNTPLSSDDEEDFYNPVECGTSQELDYRGKMQIFNPMTSSNSSFGSDIDNFTDQSFQFGALTTDCDSRCHTHRVSGHSVDFENRIGTRLLTNGLDLPTVRPRTDRSHSYSSS